MKAIQRSVTVVLGVVLVVAMIATGGCASQAPVKSADLAERVESARTRGDHEALASQYQQQADGDQESARQHRSLARAYGRSASTRGAGPAMGAHCENLARLYQQAAEENLALARLHRQAAAEAQ